MKHFFLFIVTLFIFQSNSYSQDSLRIQGFKIGITPSALINKWVGLQGVVSYTYKQFELEANVGRLIGSNEGDSYSGIRIRPVLKYYVHRTENKAYYIGFGGLHRRVDIDAKGTFGRFNDAYYQDLEFKIKHETNGLYFTFGFVMPLRFDNLLLDIGLGIGNSKMKIEHFGVPDDARYYYNAPLFTTDSRNIDETDYVIFFTHLAFLYKF